MLEVVERDARDFPDGLGCRAVYDVTLPDSSIYRVFVPAAVPIDIAKEAAQYEAWTAFRGP